MLKHSNLHVLQNMETMFSFPGHYVIYVLKLWNSKR